WTIAHVTEKLDRALEKRALEPGAAGPLVDDRGAAVGGGGDALHRLAGAFDRLAGQLQAARGGKDGTSRSVEVASVTLDEFFKTTTPEETWLCREFPIPEQCVFLVAGASHAGKSLLMLDLAVSVATGAPFLSTYKIEGTGPVLLV